MLTFKHLDIFKHKTHYLHLPYTGTITALLYDLPAINDNCWSNCISKDWFFGWFILCKVGLFYGSLCLT